MNEPDFDPSYYEEKKFRPPLTKLVSFVALALELGVAVLSLLSFDGFEECCGESIFYNTSRERTRWELAFFWTSVSYIIVVVMEAPFLLKGYPVAIFNPVLGFALTMLTMYNLHPRESWMMFGLETCATLGGSFVLFRDRNFAVLFIQMLWGYAACTVTLYCFVSIMELGGYCIVGGRLQSVFQEPTCNTTCNDITESCYICDVHEPSCFIRI